MSWLANLKELPGRTRRFFTEVRTEMSKVSFPSRDEVVGTTVVVLVASVIFATYLWVADYVIQLGYFFVIHKAMGS
jgi:preprotein translocase subunit SecE